MKNNDLLFSKQVLLLKQNELEKYLDLSKQENKELRRKLNSALNSVTQMQEEIIIDSIIMHDTIILNNNELVAPFQYADNWVSLKGSTKIIQQESTTQIDYIKMNVPLTLGYAGTEFFVTTNNPYVNITELNSARIQEKKKRWNLGVQAGLGIQYGIASRKVDFGPYIGIGLSYGFDF